MKIIKDRLYYYKGFWERPGCCNISIKENIVIATELRDNRGTSITNCIELVASQVCKDFNIKPEDLIWIERYEDTEGLDLATMDIKDGKFKDPKWKRLTEENIEALCIEEII